VPTRAGTFTIGSTDVARLSSHGRNVIYMAVADKWPDSCSTLCANSASSSGELAD